MTDFSICFRDINSRRFTHTFSFSFFHFVLNILHSSHLDFLKADPHSIHQLLLSMNALRQIMSLILQGICKYIWAKWNWVSHDKLHWIKSCLKKYFFYLKVNACSQLLRTFKVLDQKEEVIVQFNNALKTRIEHFGKSSRKYTSAAKQKQFEYLFVSILTNWKRDYKRIQRL